MASKHLAQLRNGAKNISDGVLNELNAEGFPDFMVNAFLQTAETTATIVSSRLPGGAGLDLMEANYDLKGFQIKAKSCDWGPMAGFICQLPFLNKYGYEKINYNTGYIIEYLKALKSFNSKGDIIALKKIQEALDEAGAVLKKNEDALLVGLSDNGKTTAELTAILVNLLDLKVAGEENLKKSKAALNEEEIGKITAYYSQPEIEKAFKTKRDDQAAYEKAVNERAAGRSKITRSAAYRAFFYIKNEILNVYNKKMSAIIDSYRLAENNQSTWSGENTIPTDSPAPFIELKRRFEGDADAVISELSRKYQSRHLKKVDNMIVGTAYDKGSPTPSILVDFMLREDEHNKGLWAIYYGPIKYSQPAAIGFTQYDFSSLSRMPQDAKTVEKNDANKVKLAELGIAPKETASAADKDKFYDKLFEFIGTILSNNNSEPVSVTRKHTVEEEPEEHAGPAAGAGQNALSAEVIAPETTVYYPMCGFMNPHPPYGAADADFYKNAVSGDFDLFAFWPRRTLEDVTVEQLRVSEIRLNQDLKLFLNLDQTFGIEFIPGFKELSKGGLKEDAETGNISGLGGLVSGFLNMLSVANYESLYAADEENEQGEVIKSKVKVVNRAFHSDEGGRPAVMEVEFPIAIFFPEALNTKALNNEGEVRTAMKDKAYINVKGGLIKNSEEFLQLIVDINFSPDSKNKQNAYKVTLHSEWLIHFFFVSLIKASMLEEEAAPISPLALLTAGGLQASVDTSTKENKGKLGEFQKIIDNHIAELGDKVEVFDVKSYTQNLKIILRGEKGADGNYLPLDNVTFESLRARFLNLAFESDEAAVIRKLGVRNIWPGTPVVAI